MGSETAGHRLKKQVLIVGDVRSKKSFERTNFYFRSNGVIESVPEINSCVGNEF